MSEIKLTTFKKGEKRPNQGKRGPSKATKELKEMILGALDASGGVYYLTERANDPKTASAFLSLIGKVLPMTIQGPGENGEHAFTVIERRIVKADSNK
jgi:hypothetical protein